MFSHERIETIRKTLGFKSREKFAEEIGVPFPTLRAYEQGKIENIPYSFFATLASKFNVNINWLTSGEGDMFTKNNSNSIQNVHINNGNNALDNFGTQSIGNDASKEFDEDIQDILKKAQACINENNKESFIKHVKSWIVDNL